MSTRYVWDKYQKKTNYESRLFMGAVGNNGIDTSNAQEVQSDDIVGAVFTGYSIVPITSGSDNLYYNGKGSSISIPNTVDGEWKSYSYNYLLPITNYSIYRNGEIYSKFLWVKKSDAKWYLSLAEKGYAYVKLDNDGTFDVYEIVETAIAGDYISLSTSANSSAYPKDGDIGNYYYIYKGSDVIDPFSISYSTNSPRPGSSITIRANTRTPTYGGPIYYLFSYSIDNGGTWTNIGYESTVGSKIVTVPSDATQFKGRVVASDGFGFTSTTYVTGSNLTVQLSSLNAYVGVNGKARSVSKIYVGVNGKAREVKAGYVGVNGKARKFM